MKQIKIILAALLLFLAHNGMAQTKYENEVRITTDSVPPPALKFIDDAPFNKKIRWYKEYFIEGTSIEAKTRYLGRKYSIEFAPDGQLEDIEVDQKWKKAPGDIRQQMESYLKRRFGRYTLDKLQFQYSGTTEALLQCLEAQMQSTNITLRYEVVIHTKIEGVFKRFELLFDTDGSYLRSAEFIPKNVDIIEY